MKRKDSKLRDNQLKKQQLGSLEIDKNRKKLKKTSSMLIDNIIGNLHSKLFINEEKKNLKSNFKERRSAY